jgi:hypothetical protein
MLDDAVTKARRLVADLERDLAAMDQPHASSSISETDRQAAREAIDRALIAARAMLKSLQKAAESGTTDDEHD